MVTGKQGVGGGIALPAALSSVFDISFLERLMIHSGDSIKPFSKHISKKLHSIK
jgi:hypothetical protein